MTGAAEPLGRMAGDERVPAGSWSASDLALSSTHRTLPQTAARLRGAVWAPLDALMAAGSMALAQALWPAVPGAAGLRTPLVHALAFLAVGVVVGLYDWNVWRGRRLLLLRALATSLLAAGVTVGLHYLAQLAPLERPVVALAVALSVPLAVLPRYALWVFLSHRPRRLLFVGDWPLQRRTREILQADENHSYLVVGQWQPEGDESLVLACARLGVDEVVLPEPVAELQRVLVPALGCLPLGCRVRSAADFCEDVFRAVPVEHVSADWLLSRGFDSSDHLAEVLKRGSDIALALLALAAGLPIMAAVALLVRLGGDGPVLYRQWRVGRYGRPFLMLKFRSMRPGAEHGQAVWAQKGDARPTRIGRFLRLTRLDELPQLVNILRGEMSFVGPRPERPEFTEQLEKVLPFYGWRHLVRPGLTGWAQIHYPYGASVEDARRKLEFDLYYLRHYSLLGDLGIVLRTVTQAMKGAR